MMVDALVAVASAMVEAIASAATASPSSLVIVVGCTISTANEVQPSKALRKVPCQSGPPSVMMEAGISTLVKELHPWKAYRTMLVTDEGMATLANELHP